MSGKRCLFLSNGPVSRQELFAELMDALRQLGHQVSLGTASPKQAQVIEDSLPADFSIGKPFPTDRLSFFRYWTGGLQLLLRRPDVVFIRDAALLPLGRLLAHWTHCKLVYDRDYLMEVRNQERLGLLQANPPGAPVQRKIQRMEAFQAQYAKALSQCDGFILPTSIPDMPDHLFSHKPTFISAQAAGLMPQPHSKPQAAYSLRDTYRIPDDWQIFLCVASSVSEHALFRLVDQFENLDKKALILVCTSYHPKLQKLYARICRSPHLRESVTVVIPPDHEELLNQTTDADFAIVELPQQAASSPDLTFYYGLPTDTLYQYRFQSLVALACRLQYSGLDECFNLGVPIEPEHMADAIEQLSRKPAVHLPAAVMEKSGLAHLLEHLYASDSNRTEQSAQAAMGTDASSSLSPSP